MQLFFFLTVDLKAAHTHTKMSLSAASPSASPQSYFSGSSSSVTVSKKRLVVFDFDGTIYAHKENNAPNSCHIRTVPIFLLSDLIFLQQLVRDLHANGVEMGVASFGNKRIIIDTMNELLYGPGGGDGGGSGVRQKYFTEHNVITVPDMQEQWKQKLRRISKTFKGYVEEAGGNVDKGFDRFLEKEQPQRSSKYYCFALDPESKVQMIDLIVDHYNRRLHPHGAGDRLTRSDVVFFDDDERNIRAAVKHGIEAHWVPAGGITRQYWESLAS